MDTATAAALTVAVWQVSPWVAEQRDARDQKALARALQGPTLMVVYQEADCDSWGGFIREWRRVIRDSTLHVVAVPLTDGRPDELARLTADLPPELEVRPELGRPVVRIMNDIGQAKTPFALLVDSSGQPRMSLRAWEVSNNPLEVQQAVIAVARTLLNRGAIP